MTMINEPDRWLGVELRHLAALQAVVENGSFGRAAAALGYTQPAVSQQIATLERAVGEKLLERPGGPRAVSLTEAGRLLLVHTEAIVARLRAAQADLAALSDGTIGSLRVATFQSVGARVLPRVLRRYRAGWPDIDIQLVEAGTGDDLVLFLERGEVDLSFVMTPLESDLIEATELLLDPYMLVVPAGSALARRREASLDDLADHPLVGYRCCPSVRQLEAALAARGLTPNVVFRSDDNGTLQGMVAGGIGYGVMPLLAIDTSSDETVAIPLPADFPPRVIGLGWHRDRYRSPAARAFVDAAIASCDEIASAAPVPASRNGRPLAAVRPAAH